MVPELQISNKYVFLMKYIYIYIQGATSTVFRLILGLFLISVLFLLGFRFCFKRLLETKLNGVELSHDVRFVLCFVGCGLLSDVLFFVLF